MSINPGENSVRTPRNVQRSFVAAAWVSYALIVCEILYMVSPFALYYYAAYAPPLSLLQGHPLTAFLTQNILPHFTFVQSAPIRFFESLAWPAIVSGLVLFLAGFFQIYWAKLRHRGNVASGLYRHIRHPQYAALALLGLGTSIFWPRFIAWLMYGTMVFLYYFLAKSEEKQCLRKFGAPYAAYLARTGMFLPLTIERRLKKFSFRLPESGVQRSAAIFALFILFLSTILVAGFVLRDYGVSRVLGEFSGDRAAIALAPMKAEEFRASCRAVLNDPTVHRHLAKVPGEKLLLYAFPPAWNIPELGIARKVDAGDYLVNAGTHGNDIPVNEDSVQVLLVRPVLRSPEARGDEILKNCLDIVPVVNATVDLRKNSVVAIDSTFQQRMWSGIPVPCY